jgi:hypothetical protein
MTNLTGDRRAMKVLLEWMAADVPTRQWVASLTAEEFRDLRKLLLRAAEEMLGEFRESQEGRAGGNGAGGPPSAS